MESLLHAPGPTILVAIVASPDARWAAELTASTSEAMAVRQLLQTELHAEDTSLRPANESAKVIGIADLVSWEYDLGEGLLAGHPHHDGCKCVFGTQEETEIDTLH